MALVPDPVEQVVVQLKDREKQALYDLARRKGIGTLDGIIMDWVGQVRAEFDTREAILADFAEKFKAMTVQQLKEALKSIK